MAAEGVKEIISQSSSDEGELLKLLPSDIFPIEQEVTISETKHMISSSSSQDHQLSTCVAGDRSLVRRSGALTVVAPTPVTSSDRRIFKPFPKFEWCRPEVQCISFGPSPLPPVPAAVPVAIPVCWLVCGTNGFSYAAGGFWPVLVPVYPYPVFVPVQNWVGGFGGGVEAVGAIQTQQNNQLSNRVLPLPGGGAANGDDVDENNGGTGVYLPWKTGRISSTAAGVRNRHRVQFLPKKTPMVIHNEEKQQQEEDQLNQLPSEINLPTEWTY